MDPLDSLAVSQVAIQAANPLNSLAVSQVVIQAANPLNSLAVSQLVVLRVSQVVIQAANPLESPVVSLLSDQQADQPVSQRCGLQVHLLDNRLLNLLVSLVANLQLSLRVHQQAPPAFLRVNLLASRQVNQLLLLDSLQANLLDCLQANLQANQVVHHQRPLLRVFHHPSQRRYQHKDPLLQSLQLPVVHFARQKSRRQHHHGIYTITIHLSYIMIL